MRLMGQHRQRTVDLHPSALRIELLRISPGQHLERGAGVTLQIDLALRVLMREPVRRDEVRHQDIADLTAVAIVFTGSQTSQAQKTPCGSW
jgi:hypothetical protein